MDLVQLEKCRVGPVLFQELVPARQDLPSVPRHCLWDLFRGTGVLIEMPRLELHPSTQSMLPPQAHRGLWLDLGGDSSAWPTQRKKILNMKVLWHSSGLAQPDLAPLLGCHASLGH